MCEVRQGAEVNHALIAALRRFGYGIYRAMPTMPLLVPFLAREEIDGYELNLFAARPDRASQMERDGFLVGSLPAYVPDTAARVSALEALRMQPFAVAFGPLLSRPLNSAYHDALAAYAAWRNADLSLSTRCAAIRVACETLLKLCEQAPSAPRLSTAARIGWEAGRRSVTVVALQALIANAQRASRIDEPFWPASPRFDGLVPAGPWTGWFMASAFEQYERSKNLSSYYGASGVDLDWLCGSPYTSREMQRRRLLQAWRNGRPAAVPAELGVAAADNVNAALWKSGAIENGLGI
jgi:hypothetical protein